MRIKIQGFCGKLHSWSVIHWSLATEWIKMGHQVEIFSTDGIKHFPDHLKPNLIGYVNENEPKVFGKKPSGIYDMQFSYTAMRNFHNYLQYGNKNRMGQWCYEWSSSNNKDILPKGFAMSHKHCDYLLAPSTYVKDYMFIPAKIPADKIVVVPHGIDVEAYQKNTTMKLPTKKKFKILVNLAQTHKRKNIRGVLNSYGLAFTNKDDVCLILKAKDRLPKSQFEVSINNEISKFKIKFKNGAEIKVLSTFLDDMSELYRSIDCVYSLAHGEGFNLPILEASAAGKVTISPSLGGHRDFANETNSLLVKSRFERADRKSMYWVSNFDAEWVVPDVTDAALKLKETYNTYVSINKQLDMDKEEVHKKYDWNVIAKQIIDLCII